MTGGLSTLRENEPLSEEEEPIEEGSPEHNLASFASKPRLRSSLSTNSNADGKGHLSNDCEQNIYSNAPCRNDCGATLTDTSQSVSRCECPRVSESAA